MRRALAHPLLQFALALGLAFVVSAGLTSWLSSRAAQREAIADARSVTVVLGRGVVQPALTRGLAGGEPAAVRRFDGVLHDRLHVASILRIKLWRPDGTIVYSDEPRLIGQRYGLGAKEREVMRHGGSEAERSDLTRPENRFEKGFGEVVEVYTRVVSPEGQPLLFEAYFSLADVTARKDEIAGAFRPVTLGGSLVLALLATPLVWWLTRRLRREAHAREILLSAAVDASEAERRRIARDLHDGVVQDLAGAAFALAGATRRKPAADPATLRQVGDTVRRSLASLRSLLVEIYPPDLHETGLRGALTDLLAPVEADGIDTELYVDDVAEVSATTVGLVWRVAQEAVRNAVRHGEPHRLEVRVAAAGDTVRLTVQDDGKGFRPEAAPGPGHFGLRGLRDLIREASGTLVVESVPERGTRVELEVAR